MGATIPHKKKAARGGLKFLVVDTERDFADVFSEMLLNACAQQDGVRIVASVEEAVAALENEAFDACFMDFDLADRFGFHTDTLARVGRGLTALVFLSSSPCKGSALRALNLGAKDFLVKSRVTSFDVAKSIAYALFWKYREIELEASAGHDRVTGLGNTQLFDEHLRHALEVAKRGKEKVGLLMIGLTGMEPVYEDYGDQVCDLLLKQVGERIADKVRTTDVVARLGDDEFGAILMKVSSASVVETISGTLTGAISDKPYNINGYTLKIGASVGISTYPDDGLAMDNLKALAQDALTVKKTKKQMKIQEKAAGRPFNYY